MPATWRPWVTAIVAVACATSLAACKHEQRRGRDAPGVTRADRLAYYQLATTTGALRLVVSGSAVGRPQPLRRDRAAALRLADRRLRQLAPGDPTLRRALVMLRPAVARVAGARVGMALPRATARAALGTTGRAARLLRGFAQRHPAVSALVPD